MPDMSAAGRLAVLIDGENIPPRCAPELFRIVEQLGAGVVRRVFGDWNGQLAAGWKTILPGFAIEPVQQFSYSAGGNATDMALVIAAMDLLHRHEVDGFCLVSGDGDYTPLALRLRTAQMPVYGFGPAQASAAFVRACTRFFRLNCSRKGAQPPQVPEVDEDAVALLKQAVAMEMGADGWATVNAIGSQLARLSIGFRPSKFGSKSLNKLLTATGQFDVVVGHDGNYRAKLRSTVADVSSIDQSGAEFENEPSPNRLLAQR